MLVKPVRTVFFVSDRTGITAEILGRTLLTQFRDVEFHKHTLSFVDTAEKARATLKEINDTARGEGQRPLVISTLIEDKVREIIFTADALCIDLFAGFIQKLESELGMESSHALGLTHGIGDELAYQKRIDAINYALAHDDGVTTRNYEHADVILIGVSRTGKTPTSLYLAMQYGIHAANYPLTPDDFGDTRLPAPLVPYRDKLYGLTINAERLSRIRNERKPGSRYASMENCREEIGSATAIMNSAGLHILDTSTKSVEEIAISILHDTGLMERVQR
ncbi:MAG: kinase/pyrophosphorylase [Gammaproteobacteria bacterium]|nr:MAG: kinase/pyrophosphorylase [Gammaproteobacteria bacterium]